MMKKFISALLVLVSLVSILSLSVSATNDAGNADVIWLEDGNYMMVSVQTSPARVANTVSGTKTFTVYNSSDVALWEVTLTATFAYSGAWYTCTKASANVAIYNSYWSMVSKDVLRSSNNAVVNLTMRRNIVGGGSETTKYQFKMTCNIDGTIS